MFRWLLCVVLLVVTMCVTSSREAQAGGRGRGRNLQVQRVQRLVVRQPRQQVVFRDARPVVVQQLRVEPFVFQQQFAQPIVVQRQAFVQPFRQPIIFQRQRVQPVIVTQPLLGSVLIH
jgi:hypothetical protein